MVNHCYPLPPGAMGTSPEDCGTGPAETPGPGAQGRAEGGSAAGGRGGATEREATDAGTEGKAGCGWDAKSKQI